MAKLEKKYLGNDQVDGDKIRLLNNQSFNANQANGTEVGVFRIDTSDKLQFIQMPNLPRIATQPTEAVRYDQLVAALEGLNTKTLVRAATTENLPNLAGLLTIDGVTLEDGDRVLVKDQTDPSLNGVYTASAGIWARTEDADSEQELTNAYVGIQEGEQAGKFYVQSGLILTLGVDPINFVFFNSTANLTEGDGITVVGNEISVRIQTGGGLAFDAGELKVDFTAVGGFGIEDDGSGLLRVASEIAGDGLTGGSGVPIVVEPLLTGAANIAASIDVSPLGVGIKIDGDTITENGLGQLQVSNVPADALDATVAGEGLALNEITNALDVNVDGTTIVINADTLEVGEISGTQITPGTIPGSAVDPNTFRDGLTVTGTFVDVNPDNQTIEINGSNQVAVTDGGITEAKLSPQVDAQTFDATYLPNNYTPIAVGSEPTTSISAHLKGIDEEFLNFASSDTLWSTFKAVETKSTGFTLTSSDAGKLLVLDGAVEVTIPTNATSPVPVGTVITLYVPNTATYTETIEAGASLDGSTLSSSGSYPSNLIIQFYKSATNDWLSLTTNLGKNLAPYYFTNGASTNYTPTVADTILGHIRGIDNALGSITTNLGGLSDVTIAGLTDNQILRYNSGSGEWENEDFPLHAADHVSGGIDEIDGDTLDIDWNPTNYTPVTVAETSSLDELSSHLAGIDAELATIPPLSNAIVEEFTLTAGQITSGVVLSNLAIPATVTVLIDGAPTQFNSDLSITDDGSVTTVAFSAGLQAQLTVGNIVEIKYLTDVGSIGVGSVSESRAINTDLSLTGGGDLSANRTLTLVNDALSPGNSYYYGTDSLGNKGWFLLPTEVGNAVNLSDLQDVTITTVADNELLVYDSGSGDWINQTFAEVGFSYNDLVDTPTAVSTFTNDANYLANGDNVSLLTNDANYRSTGDNVSLFNNDALYVSETDNVSLLTNDANYTSVGDAISSFTNDLGYLVPGDINTLAGLNAIIGDATLDDSSDPRTPTAHSSTHISSGSDPIDSEDLANGYVPSNYTRTVNGTTVTIANSLGSHLLGIDNALNSFQATSVITEQFTLDATDISTNGYVDLANPAAALLDVVITGLSEQFIADFVLTTPVTNGRVTWDASITPSLTVGDVLEVTYVQNVGIAGLATNSHASTHLTGGSDEIDGDKLDIDFTPTNYTPSTSPVEVDNVNHLSAHLSGIDSVLASVGSLTFPIYTESASSFTINATNTQYYNVIVNCTGLPNVTFAADVPDGTVLYLYNNTTGYALRNLTATGGWFNDTNNTIYWGRPRELVKATKVAANDDWVYELISWDTKITYNITSNINGSAIMLQGINANHTTTGTNTISFWTSNFLVGDWCTITKTSSGGSIQVINGSGFTIYGNTTISTQGKQMTVFHASSGILVVEGGES